MRKNVFKRQRGIYGRRQKGNVLLELLMAILIVTVLSPVILTGVAYAYSALSWHNHYQVMNSEVGNNPFYAGVEEHLQEDINLLAQQEMAVQTASLNNTPMPQVQPQLYQVKQELEMLLIELKEAKTYNQKNAIMDKIEKAREQVDYKLAYQYYSTPAYPVSNIQSNKVAQ